VLKEKVSNLAHLTAL